MKNIDLKELFSNKKVMLSIILGVMLILFITTFIIIEAVKDHAVKEVLFDVQKSELFVVRDDGKEMKVELEIAIRDRLFRQNDFLIHQHYKAEQNIITTVYKVDAKNLLTSVFKKEGNVVYYKDNQNYIYDNGMSSTIVENGKEKAINKLCREANYFNDLLICLNSDGTLYTINGDKVETLQGKDGKEVFVVTFAIDSKYNKIYLGTATKDESPVNKVLVLNNNLDVSKAEEYLVDYIPTRFTVQPDRVVLNSRVMTTGETLDSFKLFVLNNGIMQLEGYRDSLMIVY